MAKSLACSCSCPSFVGDYVGKEEINKGPELLPDWIRMPESHALCTLRAISKPEQSVLP